MDAYIARVLVFKALVGLIAHLGPSMSSNNLSINVDDNIMELYFDGIQITNLPNAIGWTNVDRVPLPDDTKVIAVHGRNTGNTGWLLATDADGKIFTDKYWKYSTAGVPGWMNENFDDSHWKTVTEIALNDGLTPGFFYMKLISRHAAFIWSPGWDANSLPTAENDVYFRYKIQENALRRDFDWIKSGLMVKGIGGSCTRDTRLRCAVRCGQLPMSVCAAFQHNSVSGACCFINGSLATTGFVLNLAFGANWRIYSAVDFKNSCC